MTWSGNLLGTGHVRNESAQLKKRTVLLYKLDECEKGLSKYLGNELIPAGMIRLIINFLDNELSPEMEIDTDLRQTLQQPGAYNEKYNNLIVMLRPLRAALAPTPLHAALASKTLLSLPIAAYCYCPRLFERQTSVSRPFGLLDGLHSDILALIVGYLNIQSLLTMRKTCNTLRNKIDKILTPSPDHLIEGEFFLLSKAKGHKQMLLSLGLFQKPMTQASIAVETKKLLQIKKS